MPTGSFTMPAIIELSTMGLIRDALWEQFEEVDFHKEVGSDVWHVFYTMKEPVPTLGDLVKEWRASFSREATENLSGYMVNHGRDIEGGWEIDHDGCRYRCLIETYGIIVAPY